MADCLPAVLFHIGYRRRVLPAIWIDRTATLGQRTSQRRTPQNHVALYSFRSILNM